MEGRCRLHGTSTKNGLPYHLGLGKYHVYVFLICMQLVILLITPCFSIALHLVSGFIKTLSYTGSYLTCHLGLLRYKYNIGYTRFIESRGGAIALEALADMWKDN